MKVDCGANARVGVHVTPDFVQHRGVSPLCLRSLALRRMPCGPERRVSDPVRWGIPRQSFSFLRSSCLFRGRREEGQSGTLCRRSGIPSGHRLGTGRSTARRGHGGVCGCGTSPRRVLALRDGGGVRSAGRHCLRLIPLLRKRCHHIHTQTPAHLERAARTSTCHSRHAPVARARLSGTVHGVGM